MRIPLPLHVRKPRAGLLLTRTLLAASTFVCALLGSVYGQTDNFNDGDDNGWSRYSPLTPFGAGTIYTFPSGGYRIQAPASPNPALVGPARGGSIRLDTSYTDFSISVDVVNWDNDLDQVFGLAARITTPGLSTTKGYILTYFPVADQLNIQRLDNESPVLLAGSATGVVLNPANDYRFVFRGIGANLFGEVFDLTDLSTPVATIAQTDGLYASGSGGLFVATSNTGAPMGAGDATFDNYLAVPEPSTIALLGMAALARLAGRRRRTASA